MLMSVVRRVLDVVEFNEGFRCVSHSVLLKKIAWHAVMGKVWEMLPSYMVGRKQLVGMWCSVKSACSFLWCPSGLYA